MRRFELALFAAWHVAALSRAERLPDLGELMQRVSDAGDDQDPDEQMHAARAIVVAFGSEENR